ncbi:MAG: hypothetical protein RIQ93_1500 [Verrucomicrobiota bacterium]|jgi:hypothetical protein
MKDPFVIVWTLLIFASIFWYGFLVFYVGNKAGKEILQMTKTLGESKEAEKKPPA